MTDAVVSVNFRASTSDLESGVGAVREALASLAAPISDINSKYAALGAALADSHTQAAQAIASGDKAAYADALQAAQEALTGQVKAEQEALSDKLRAYADDARNHRMSEQDKLGSSRDAIEQSYALELDLESRREALAQSSLAERQRISNQIMQIEENQQRALLALNQEALDAQTQAYEQFGGTIAKTFDSQWKDLLSGAESWGDAARKALGDLVIQFIEGAERMAVQWAAGELAKTSATATGTSSRAALEAAGSSAMLATQGAAIVKSILGSAAEAFAGVFGFLAPVMGPFAAGPAAAAQATVAGAAATVASADIGMWSVPADMLTLVHQNELIMPAAEAGVFRNMLSRPSTGGDASGAVSINPSTHFHVNAIDGASVSQWMRSNSSQMLRAIDEAVRHGAHLGLRRLSAS